MMLDQRRHHVHLEQDVAAEQGSKRKQKRHAQQNQDKEEDRAKDKGKEKETMGRGKNTETIKKEGGNEVSRKDFTVIKPLGCGEVAKVYLVRHNKTEQLFAMKVFDKHEMIKRNKVKRVMTEREILATIKHPFIVSLYCAFQTKNKLHLVMDYCAGGDFFRVLQQQSGKRLTESQTRFYGAEVSLALEYLHMMGFTYRDLKPKNLLLHESGHVMLTDFDLSKQAATPVSPRVVTQFMTGRMKLDTRPDVVAWSFVGTEEYIAPEVVEGYGHTSSVDWWAFGILLYEMVYGHTPFRERRETDGALNHTPHKGSPEFPDSPTTSKEIKNLIKRLLATDPQKRLGAKHGAADIKEHPFFKGKVSWALIRNQQPPIRPGPSNSTSSSLREMGGSLHSSGDEDAGAYGERGWHIPPLLEPHPRETGRKRASSHAQRGPEQVSCKKD